MVLIKKFKTSVIISILFFGLVSIAAAKKSSETEQTIDLSAYSTITITDFSDGTEKRMLPRIIKKQFADELANNLKMSGAYNGVNRVKSLKKAADTGLIVKGRVMKFKQASQRATRLDSAPSDTHVLGSSHFDIRVTLLDAKTQEKIAIWEISKNAFGKVGGQFRRKQERVEHYMDEALNELTVKLVTARLAKTK